MIRDGVLRGLNSQCCIVQDDPFILWVGTGRGVEEWLRDKSSSSYRGRSVTRVGKHIQGPSIGSLNTNKRLHPLRPEPRCVVALREYTFTTVRARCLLRLPICRLFPVPCSASTSCCTPSRSFFRSHSVRSLHKTVYCLFETQAFAFREIVSRYALKIVV